MRLGMLSNAAIHLGGVAGARTRQWQDEMAAIAPQVATLAQLRAVGQVLAWRAGVAHFRLGAIAAADTLPPALALAAFGEPQLDWPSLARATVARSPGAAMPDGIEFGAFAGLGGEFATPPQVRATDDGFIVSAGERFYLLVADAHGAVLHGASADEYAQASSDVPASLRLDGATLHLGARTHGAGPAGRRDRPGRQRPYAGRHLALYACDPPAAAAMRAPAC